MTKKHDIVFNLTIDDLKELGIIKKRRRRGQRRIKYINSIPSNIKSSSDHMTGYSNLFTNTENLKTENLRLQNDYYSKLPMIKNCCSVAYAAYSYSTYTTRLSSYASQYPVLRWW